ncbi:MAG: hypothetical protein EKK57_10835 [Proteobacteria bacterium]|nr:MAG: hypothetical protein EKK57_10835 [Pseudomonadota bacterium]
MNIDLFDYTVERHCLAALAHHNYIYPEIDQFIKDTDFYHPIHRTIYKTICSLIEEKSSTNDPLIIAKLKGIGISKFEDDINIDKYIQSLCRIPVSKDAWRDFYANLLEFRVKRDIYNTGIELQKLAQKVTGISNLIDGADKVYSENTRESISINKSEAKEICEGLEDRIEYLGNNPVDESKMLMGPFPSVNKLYGSLHRPGNITLLGARSGVAKTSLSLFYNIFMAEKYNMPIYWQDHGEMSAEELQIRIAAIFSGGSVPLYAIENGEWRKNPLWVQAIRSGLPRAKKIKIYYQSVANMGPNKIISTTRRFKYNKVGRENKFLWVFDYIKPFDVDTDNSPEWKQMGHFIQHIKSFIQEEIDNPFFSSIQLNKSGTTNNKKSSDVDDSENSISISDRITQQTSHTFIIRRKVNDELEAEGMRFGNLKAIPVKTRFLGREADRALGSFKMPNGRYKNNYVNLDFKNFNFYDKGDLVDILPQLNDIYTIADEPDESKKDLIE